MGAIGLVESVEWSLASSSLTKCSSVRCTTINILRSLLKAALACLVLCWRAKNILISADRHSCAAGPQGSALLMFQQYSLGHAHWWRSLSSDFSCPWWLWIQALLLQSGVPAHSAWFAVASSSWVLWHWGVISTNSEGLEWGVWCSWRPLGQCQPLEFYQSCFFVRGAHISNPRFGQSVMGHAVFCFVYFQPLAALACCEQPPTSNLVILLPLDQEPARRNCSEGDEMTC